MKEVRWQEGTFYPLTPELAPRLRRAVEGLRRTLRPRLKILTEAGGRFRIDGIIGTVQLDAATRLYVEPKTRPGDDWVGAVLELLLPRDRLHATSIPAAPQLRRRRDPLDAIAGLYLSRIERALRRDGPLVVLARSEGEAQILKGRLRAAKWLRQATWKPHLLPFEHTRLSADNDFSRVLAYTCMLLSKAATALHVRVALSEVSRLLRPGYPDVAAFPSDILSRELPGQWAIYRPAWEIARMVLGSRSLMGPSGKGDGLTLAIEAWPLLEHLLHRILRRVSAISAQYGRVLESEPQRGDTLLSNPQGSAVGMRRTIPDGRLRSGNTTIAVFDAKYSRRGAGWPDRAHVSQVLTAAAASGAETAVLVFPESFPPAVWKVSMGASGPTRFICLGLDMFRFAGRPDDEDQRASMLIRAVNP